MSTSTPPTRRRRFPWWLLGVAFVVVPLVEIWTIIQVGQVIGAWWTLGLLVLSGVVGSWLVKREGARTMRAFRDALSAGRMPHRELADGILILVGGTLMLTPGFVSDVLGILMILPLTRPLGRTVLAGAISRRLVASGGPGLTGGGAGFGPGPGTGPVTDPRARRRPGPGDVVQGEVVD
ncbi:hypothetical protein ASG49_07445 [Marmoricola sp. Leaf446]|uniref:FxsA family protein n=1 Tax=Marmoricola sp. Leaf446 TaxID=1736379 RepID=UPI0006FB064B|nr:FxsA family protein [Marmoricola sp. Leaf446]KQT94662.1 hypothetical protein ASG49_07445 [Marmoricola sp. Leaf446]